MKTVDLIPNSKSADELLALASSENVIVRTEDGREFVIAEVDDFEREVELVRRNEELMKFLDERSQDKTSYSLDEVRRQLGL